MAQPTYTRQQFAAKIKEKYPVYAEMDDNELVDKIIAKYPVYADQISEGKIEEPQMEDASAAPEDTASTLVEGSSESQETRQPGMLGALEEPASHFLGTLGNIMAGATQMFESLVYKRAQALVEEGKIDPKVAQEQGVFTNEALNAMTAQERMDLFEEWSLVGNDMAEKAAKVANLHADKDYGSGSIFTELGDGNYANAANLTVNQSAAGLASLVPFLVPGGVVLGPTLLGASAGGGAFQENIARENATMEQIYKASMYQAGNEFVWEAVTAGIVGRAKKMLAGGASREAVEKFTQAAWKRVAGESTKEGFSEGITDTGSKIINNLIFGDEHTAKEYVVGFADSAIVGSIIGGKVATFGELGDAGTVQQKVAAQTLRTPEQKAETEARARKAAEAQKIIDSYAGRDLEGSLVEQAELEAAEEAKNEAIKEEKEAEQKHIDTLNDMTKQELLEFAKNQDKANKLEKELEAKQKQAQKEAKVNPEFVPEDTAVIEDAIYKAREKAYTAYNTVANWRETTAAINKTIKNNKDKIKEIEQEEGNIKLEEKQAAKAEQPNPVGTRKRKQRAKKLQQEKVEVQKNIDALEKVKDQARPTTADAKTRKRRAKKKPTSLPESATKPIKDAAQRSDANEDLAAIIADPDIPSTQKERAISQVFKVNAPLIGQIAGNLAAKNSVNRKEVETLLKSEVGRRVHETGKIDKNTWNTAQKSVDRLLKKERETVKRNKTRSTELRKELREIDQQVLDGILDAEAAEIIKDDIRREYGEGEGGTTQLTTTTAEGDTQIRSDVEKASKKGDKQQDKAELVAKAMAGRSVKELFEDVAGNSETIFALLPTSATNRRAFSGIFADGNPVAEIWESYFDKSDEAGRKRWQRLKKAVQETLDDVQVDSESTTTQDIMEGAFDFMETRPFKVKPRTVKETLPLLAKLRKAFPGVKIYISKAKMMERLLESNQVDAAAAVQNNKIRGFVDENGNVYLNEDAIDYEAPIHEFGHIWAKATRSGRPDLYKKGIELLKGTSIYEEIFRRAKDPKSVYHGLSKKQLEEEAMATAIGRYGHTLFDKVGDQKNWDSWVKTMFRWMSEQLGLKTPLQDLKVGEFMNIAVTEILTGQQLVQPIDSVRLNKQFQDSMVSQFLEVPPGSTRDYTPKSKPIAEFDTHGVFKGQSVKKELYTALNRYWDDIQQGGWLGYTTGSYGDAVVGTPKFNAKLNGRIEAKVRLAKEIVEGEGLQFKRDPRNPGFHVISKPGPISSFLETPKQQTAKGLEKQVVKAIKNALKPYKTPSPFKYSRVDEETKNVLKATLADIQSRDGLPLEVLQKLQPTVNEAIKTGRSNIKAQKETFKERQKVARESANSFVRNSSNVDPEKITKTEANILAKKKDKWVNKIFNKNLISNTLAPSTNNDFYGLLYNLLPEGKLRETARSVLDNLITKPLEKANIDYLNAKAKLRENWVAAKVFAITGKDPSTLTQKQTDKALSKANDMLNAESTIEFAGRPLRNYDIVKVYNYLKDPSTYRSVENTLDNDTLDAIVDYVNSNKDLKGLADLIPGVYAGVAGEINAKLASHGRETFGKTKIDKEALTPEQKERLEKIYGGEIPAFAKYTPLTSEGAETDADVDKLIAGDNYAMYTVMDGRLKKRTGGGEIVLHSNNLDGDFDRYLNGPVRTMAFLDFAKNASDFFGPKQMTAMRAAYGDQWARAMKDSLRRIVTGKNQPSKQNAATRALDKWINRTVGTVMSVNTRSAVLQLISTGNFAVNDPQAVFSGMTATRQEKDFVKNFLKNSEWVKERGKGKVDLAVDAIFADDKASFIDQVLQKGYVLTKLGDKFAITVGGSPFMIGKYRQYLKEGLPQEDAIQKAYADFVAQAEETQQSTRPERLGQSQTTQMGKLILAFANTPMQYNRKMARAIKDLRASGTNPQRKKQAARELVYYGALQNMVFTSLQRLLLPGVDDDEGKTTDWVNSLANTLLRGIGVWGAVVAAAKDALIAASRGKDVYDPLINVAPAVGTKVRHIRTALGTKKIYAQSSIIDDAEIYQYASGINAITNLPADRAVKIVEQVADAFSSDFTWYQSVLRALGWSRYDLGVPASSSPLNKKNSPFDRCRHGSPLKGGEAGQAFKDGTIEVDPNLSPEEKAKTIAHEKQHVRDMDDGILDYDDNNVYYHGTPFERKDGEINYHGKWYKEGHPDLPWEARAYAVEEDSPLNQNGDDTTRNRDRVRKKRKELKEMEEKYNAIGYLEPDSKTGLRPIFGGVGASLERLDPSTSISFNDEYSDVAKWIGDWESDPETEKRFKEQYPTITDDELLRMRQKQLLSQQYDIPQDVLDARKDAGFDLGGLYDKRTGELGVNPNLSLEERRRVVAHELGHGGLDTERGAHAADIIGHLEWKDFAGERNIGHEDYLNTEAEMGAYLMDARFTMGVKAGQEVTPEMVEELLKNPNTDWLRAIKKNGKEKELLRAFNEVAAVEQQKMPNLNPDEMGLMDFYSRKQSSGLARLKDKYRK